MYKKILYVLILLIGFSKGIRSEIVILKSGERIEGKIINQSRTKIELQKEDGTKLVIDKDNIEKIQFGPTQREIEEKKRKEEEQHRKEEERLRQEEERRRIEEELRRQEEEERLKKQEERRLSKIQKEPLEKRHGLEIGFGVGPAYIVPSLFKVYDLFFTIFERGFFFSDNEVVEKDILRYDYNSENIQFFIKYVKNDIEIGFSYTGFKLDELNFKSVYKFQERIFVPGKNIILGEPEYNMYNLWFINNIRQFRIYTIETIFGIETNLYNINTKINQVIDYESNFGKKNLVIEFKTKTNNFISLGPNVRFKIKPQTDLKIGILLTTGRMEPTLGYLVVNNFSFGNEFNRLSIDFTDPLQAKGIYFRVKWDYSIYKNTYVFLEYLYNENQYKIGKMKATNLSKSKADSRSIPFVPDFLIGTLLTGQKKVAIEKNQYLNVGLSYRFNFL